MFDLLAPFFAAVGVVAGIVPIVLHMLKRTPSDRQPFSLVRFLKPSLPKLTRRSRIEHWPLMLLRILALLLIAAAFARPFQRLAVSEEESTARRNRIAVLVDASASMRREGIPEAVVAQLRDIANSLTTDDIVSVTTFSEASRTLISAEQWLTSDEAAREAMISKVIEDYQPDWMGTRTGTALLSAADEVTQESHDSGNIDTRKIILITDFQRGSSLDELKSAEWPSGVEIDLRLMKPTVSGNAGLSLVQDPRDGSVRVRVSNSADASKTDYQLQPFDREGKPIGQKIPVSVSAGQRQSAMIPLSAEGTGALIAGVELEDDSHPFDNVVDLPVIDNPVIRIAHLGSTDANDPASMRYYLQRVVDGSDAIPIELVDLKQADGVTVPTPADIRLVIISEAVPSGLITSLQECIARGGIVFAAPRNVADADSLKPLLPDAFQFSEAEVSDYAMLGNIDFSHPLFSAFSDVQFSDYSTIRFRHYRTLDYPKELTQVRRLAQFDSGSPAMIQIDHETGGRLVLLLSGWHPDDSQLALSTRFPPMVYRFVQLAHPRVSGQQLFSVGDIIRPAEILSDSAWSLKSPTGETVLADSTGTTEPSAAAVTLTLPGTWSLVGGPSGKEKTISLLVSVSASESRTDPLPVGQLQALGLNAEVQGDETVAAGPELKDASQLNVEELETRQKYWKWLLLAGMICLALESLLAQRIESRQPLESAT